MRNGLAIVTLSVLLASCGSSADDDTGAASAIEQAVVENTLDISDPCAFLTMDDVSAVFEGVTFEQTVTDVQRQQEFDVEYSECDYEVANATVGQRIYVEFSVTQWQDSGAARDYFDFTKPSDGDEITLLDQVGDQAAYEEAYARDGLIREGRYTFFVEVRRPEQRDADVQTPSIALMRKIGEKL